MLLKCFSLILIDDTINRALTVMFEIMKTHGKDYKVAWWRDLFNIIFRIFDHMRVSDPASDLSPEVCMCLSVCMYASVICMLYDFLFVCPCLSVCMTYVCLSELTYC